MIRPQISDIECRQDFVVIEQFYLVSFDRIFNVCCRSSYINKVCDSIIWCKFLSSLSHIFSVVSTLIVNNLFVLSELTMTDDKLVIIDNVET